MSDMKRLGSQCSVEDGGASRERERRRSGVSIRHCCRHGTQSTEWSKKAETAAKVNDFVIVSSFTLALQVLARKALH